MEVKVGCEDGFVGWEVGSDGVNYGVLDRE